MLTKSEQSILDALEPQASKEGVEIVTVEIVGAKKSPTIRVYIDCPGGVGFDELAAAQQWVNATVDALDPFPGAYMLEVSSPGIDRPLRTREHFEAQAGEKAQIVLVAPLEGRAKWTGVLEGMEGDDVILAVDGNSQRIPYTSIKKAHVIGTIDFNA